jgi:hypothetical protein
MGLLRQPAFDTPCRIEVEQSEAHFHAHVELEGDVAIQPGDKVRVHGAPIIVGFGQSVVIERMATVQPAGPLMRAWTRLTAMGELKELYEVSFTTNRF